MSITIKFKNLRFSLFNQACTILQLVIIIATLNSALRNTFKKT